VGKASYPVGVTAADAHNHAVVRRRLLFHWALCGAGRVSLVLSGRFDPADRMACPACAAAVREQGSSGA
jgi:hypothetical protein